MDKIKRNRGTGRVFCRGTSWYWRVRVNGQEITKRLVMANNEEEALAEARRLAVAGDARTIEEVAMFAGRARKVIRANTAVSLNDSFDVFKNSSGRRPCSADTLARHKRIWGLFINFVKKRRPGIVNIAELTVEDAEAWADAIDNAGDEKVRERDQLNARGFNGYLCTARLITRILIRHGAENIFEHVLRKSGPVDSKKDFTEDQLGKVFAAVDKDYPLSVPHRAEMRILFRIAAYTGLRLKCCCLLRREDIDLAAGIMTLTPYKTEKSSNIEVKVPIAPGLAEWLPVPAADNQGSISLSNVRTVRSGCMTQL